MKNKAQWWPGNRYPDNPRLDSINVTKKWLDIHGINALTYSEMVRDRNQFKSKCEANIYVYSTPDYKQEWVSSISFSEDNDISVWGIGSLVDTNLTDPRSTDIILEAVTKWRKIKFKQLEIAWRNLRIINKARISASKYPTIFKKHWLELEPIINLDPLSVDILELEFRNRSIIPWE